MKQSLIILIIFLLYKSSEVYGSHIVGGEIYYECLGNFQYKIIAKVYRDCWGGLAFLDGDPNGTTLMKIGVFKADGSSMPMAFPVPVITPVVPNISKECMISPPKLCLEEGYYEFILTLPPSVGGYDITNSRCCRNNSINNLKDPGSQGATFWAHIPDPGEGCNNGPRFKNYPPVIICTNENLNFDHSAVDPDGDSLAYFFCDPFQGGSQSMPAPGPSAPPFTPVVWGTGYSAANPVDANPPLRIDAHTGLITGRPTTSGQYIVGVCVKEYKNGVLINTHRRDFQFNITECLRTIDALIYMDPSDSAIVNCDNYTVSFKNLSKGATKYHWDFGVPNSTSDTSNLKDPTFTFPDTGHYRVTLIAEPGVLCSDEDYVDVYIFPVHKSNFTYDRPCPNDTMYFKDSSETTFGSVVSWQWFFGNGEKDTVPEPIIVYGHGSDYTVTMVTTTDKGCRSAISKKVELYPLPIPNFTYDSSCIHKPVNFTDHSTISTGNIDSYIWQIDEDTVSFNKDMHYTFDQPGDYKVKLAAISDNGCKVSIVKNIIIKPRPVAVAAGDTAICLNEKTQLSASGGVFYAWTPAQFLDNEIAAATLAAPKSTTVYTVKVYDECYWDTATVTVEVLPLPEIVIRSDTSIFRGDSVFLFAKGTGNFASWSPAHFISNPSSESTYAVPIVTTTYTFTNKDGNGCVNKKDIIVYIREICNSIYIPNAFSPNGDGVNDIFYIKDYGDSRLVLFQVFNRWGKKVYETRSLEQGWDGKDGNREIETGTYSYRIIIDCGERIVQYGGNITLLK